MLVRAVLVGALLVVCLNAWMAIRSVRILDEAQYWVSHTWQVMNTAERLMGSMKDAETGNRGYLLTGNPEYLEPYARATRELPDEINQLASLTSDNPHEQARISILRGIVSKRLQNLQTGIDERRNGETNEANLLVQSGTGEAEMDHLRALANDMENEERGLLIQRIANARSARNNSVATLLLASFINVLLIALIFRLLGHERRMREKSDAIADRLQKLQTISDIGLTQLTLSELIDSLLERLLKVVQADGVVFCDWNDSEIKVVAASGVKIVQGRIIKLDPGSPLYSAGMTQSVVTTEGYASQLPLDGMRNEMRTILILPVVVAGKVAALLIVGRKLKNAFQDQDESLLTVVADRIGMALDRSNAYEAERGARRLAEESAAEVRKLNNELEARVQLRTAELQTINRELEAFSYSVSHDLRAPLRSIDGFSLALEEDFANALTDDGRDYIRRIRSGVQRMGLLIDSLLQLSRITRADLLHEYVNLSELAEEVARDMQVQNPGRKLVFRIEPDLVAFADARLLRVALENLMNNAVKFTARQPEAIIELGRSGTTGEFFIRDNGAGFDMRYANKLFQAFQRLHGDKDFVGSGIGLATVSRVIRRHLGTIRAEGAENEGATFWFTVG